MKYTQFDEFARRDEERVLQLTMWGVKERILQVEGSVWDRIEPIRVEELTPEDWEVQILPQFEARERFARYVRLEKREWLKRARSVRFLLATAVRLLPLSERARYLEEFRAELLDVHRGRRLGHALSLLRGVFVLRLRRGPKNKPDAAARRAKG